MWRGAPLWLKLVTGLLGIVALALALNALVGRRLLRSYLVDRVDDRLVAVARPLADHPPDPSSDGRPQDLASPYYVGVMSPSGRVVDQHWAPLDPDDPAPALPALRLAETRHLGGHPFTVEGTGGRAGWRAVALPLDDEDGSLVVAMSLGDVDGVVGRTSTVSVVGGIALMGAAAAAVYLLVRRLVAPLPGIEHAALALIDGDGRGAGDGDGGLPVPGARVVRAPEGDLHTELGRIGHAFNAMADDRDATRHAREQAEGAARQADRRLKAFVADASRELRRPLNALRGYTELFRQDGMTDPDDLDDLLRQIDQEARAMGLLVDDLLLLARLDQQHPLASEPVDVGAAARDAAAAARVVALDRAIVCVAPEGPLVVLGDETRLRHAVANLVDNAVSHTPPGTPVEIEIGRTRRDGRNWAALEVRDHGRGLSPEQAERVFDRFYRTDQARRRPGGTGSGLGLAIVDAIVTAHGGIVEVDTTARQGAVFRVLLPLVDDDEPPAPGGLVKVARAGPARR